MEYEIYQQRLAKRLGIDLATLEREYSKLSPNDFDIWCRSRVTFHSLPSNEAWDAPISGEKKQHRV